MNMINYINVNSVQVTVNTSSEVREVTKTTETSTDKDFYIPSRGDIVYVNFGDTTGSEQGGIRPAVVLQNNKGNKHSPTIIVAAITSKQTKAQLPTHVKINNGDCGLPKDSVVLLEQVRTIDKKRILNKIGKISDSLKEKINKAALVSFGL